VNPRRLYRSADDRWIAGVAAGVADYFDVDPILVRIIWLIAIPFSAGFVILAYIIMAVVVPQDSGEMPPQSPWQPGGAPVGNPGYQGGYPGGAPLGYAGTYTPPAAAAGDPNATTTGEAPAAGPGATLGADAPAGAVPTGPAPVGPTPGAPWGWQGREDRWQRRAERWQRRSERRGSGGIVFGAMLIVIGGLFAWNQIFPNTDLSIAWPIAIIAFGVFLVATSLGFRRGE
jgi:phage shock protein C